MTEPHLHVLGEREFEGQPLGKLHLPTGYVEHEGRVVVIGFRDGRSGSSVMSAGDF